jgi:serine protease Do
MDSQNSLPDPDLLPDRESPFAPPSYAPGSVNPASPAAASPEDVPPPGAKRSRRPSGPLLPVIAVSLLSATIASVGTTALLRPSQTGAANPSPAVNTTTSVVHVDSDNAVVDVAAKVSPAVVTITSSSVNTRFGPFSVPATGVGSGFIFDSNGYILTNWHVVEGNGTLTVTLKDGRDLAARVVASDPEKDLAVVKVDATNLPTAQIGSSSNLQVGQLVVAIGSPLGTFTDSVTSGILSGTGREITVTDPLTRQQRTVSNLLQTDAAINEGNSGGPLLDATGRVIGINSAAAASAQGIGFAIPIDDAQAIIAKARTV